MRLLIILAAIFNDERFFIFTWIRETLKSTFYLLFLWRVGLFSFTTLGSLFYIHLLFVIFIGVIKLFLDDRAFIYVKLWHDEPFCFHILFALNRRWQAGEVYEFTFSILNLQLDSLWVFLALLGVKILWIHDFGDVLGDPAVFIFVCVLDIVEFKVWGVNGEVSHGWNECSSVGRV